MVTLQYQCLSDTSKGILIWSNLILDLSEISKFHIYLKSNHCKLTLEQYVADTSKNTQMIFKGDP